MNLAVEEITTDLLLSGSRRVHLIGVAGSGMSGLAGLLLALGHEVSGSDRVSTGEIQRLQKLGLRFHLPQTAETVHGAELIIYSSAIRTGNPAFDEARRLGLPMLRRAEALAAVMSLKKGIVIAGMHGKTTTTAMAAHVLRCGRMKPSHYVGAEIPLLGTNAWWESEGEYFVAEGDESDGTLTQYKPEHCILLNVEEEHLDYYEDLPAIERVFRTFLEQTRGTAFYCVDDPHAARLGGAHPQAVSFGFGERADYRGGAVSATAFGSDFEVSGRGRFLGRVFLGVPGHHNVSNALGVIALALELGLEFRDVAGALESFRGARRRFEVKLAGPEYTVIDDYGHHPTEIRATLATAKALDCARILVMFQPHRYSRTLALKEEFGRAFAGAGLVYVTEVYAASERPIAGVDGNLIVSSARAQGFDQVHYFPKRQALHREVGRVARPGDLIISLGAGDIHEEAAKLVQDLQLAAELREVIGAGEVRLYEPLSKHTTLRVGGPAQFWVEPETCAGLSSLLAFCSARRLPVFVLGRGSNLLVRDGGIPGVVIHLDRGDFLSLKVRGHEIHAGAGLRLKQVCAAARTAGLGGFEWMEGIPGSVGGCLRMNAGAMGSEAFQQVVSVQTMNVRGEFETLYPDQMDVRYRNVPALSDRIAVSAGFRGFPASLDEINDRLEASIRKRKATQPIAASAGCIFKNPVECPAGRLVEELGLKNLSAGAARVSEVHGNFIVNDGGAKASDVLDLIEEIRSVAKRSRGIDLETEVQIIGVADA
ncbi:MAG: UDP-N-acetylmuramate--L-alanine ligase [Verrucomicrobia bacterium]|nr:UDP-N-acetylmuramate--L-alanine ligase [Verrucomicrobiota bacterium]